MRKLLWIGSYMDAETETYLKETILYKKPSTSLSQRNILVGIEQNMGQQFDCVGAVSMHGFPRDKSIRVPAVSFQRPGGRTAMLVGFLNPMYANKLLMASSLKCAVKKWVKQNSGDDGLDIFVYEARSACLAAAVWIKKRIPGTRIHLIVPDIPQYMDLHMSGLKRVLKRLDWNTIKRYFLKIDRFIVYTEAMVDALGIRNRPWMRMEGSIPLFQEVHRPMLESAAEEAACIIMYSGSINLKFGIGNLIQAMDMLGSRYTLWLTGMGPDAEAVREAAEKRDNIQFFGFMKDQSEVMRLQSRATALINMRDPDEEASKYCFPSKIFEYMLSGKPVLSCKLGGIPEEYFDYLIEMKSIQPEDIAQAIRGVAAKSPEARATIGQKGQQFIREQKNNIAQAKRIIEFALKEQI